MRVLRLLILPAALALVPADVLAQSAPPAGAPAGMEAVRARIRQIRGEAPAAPAPVIVVVPVAAPAGRDGRDGRDGADGWDGRAAPFTTGLPPALAAPLPGIVYVPPRRPPGAGPDTTAANAPSPAPDAPPVTDPVRVAEAERALLDTGLFRALGVNFAFDRATLLDGATRVLDPVGEVLRRYPDLRVEVGGHTDAIGSEAYNQRLSERRAETVRRYLVERWGIAPERLTSAGYGESRPFSEDAGETGRALNRRVEFAVTGR